jgi:quercetin dioxygenase-like cupin family protein
MRPKHVVVVVGVLLAGLVTGVALATPGSGATSTLFSAGTFSRDAHARQSANADAQIVDVAFAPGGYTGWHSHPGTEVVTVKSGAVTLKRVREGECRIHTYTAGQAFAAYPQDTFIVMNASATDPAEMVVVLFNIPTGGPNRIDRADPGIC